MNTSETPNPGAFLTPGKLIALGVLLAAALIMGIKFFVGGGGGEASEESQASGDIFKDSNRSNANPGYNPASRPEPAGPGDSLGMFTKTNEGYAKEGEEAAGTTAPAEGTAVQELKKTESAAAAQAGAGKAPAAGTVIPRLQPTKGFGSAGAGKAAGGMPKGMPDVSAIIQSATKDVGKQKPR